jgi:hypothetical protein
MDAHVETYRIGYIFFYYDDLKKNKLSQVALYWLVLAFLVSVFSSVFDASRWGLGVSKVR